MAGKSLLKIKPKKYKIGDVVEVQLMTMHPMETGMRKDKKTGDVIPAHYIDEVKFFYDKDLITTIKSWESISANPVIAIKMKITKAGELTAKFKDNLGELSEKSKKIKPEE